MSSSRLNKLRLANDATGEAMRKEAGRFGALASRHADGTAPRAVASCNLFQTPEATAAIMAERIVEHANGRRLRILEPSAGLGRLYVALSSRMDSDFVLVDESPDCIRELYAMTETAEGITLRQGDFMGMTTADIGEFDAVCMNPPFKMWRDIRHIRHALTMLKPGGLLIALCANGPKQRATLEPLADTWEELPEGTFRAEGTGAIVVLLTIEK